MALSGQTVKHSLQAVQFSGFQTGWLAYLSRVASVGANTNLLVTYASWIWAPLDTEPYRSITLAVIITSLTWLNARGVRNSIGAMYLFTILKLLPLSLLILFGFGHIDLQMLFGAEGTVVTAGEGRNPRKDLPRALVQTIVAIGIIYVLIQLVAINVLPELPQSSRALADVAAVLFGPAGAAFLTLGAVFSILGNTHSSVLSAPRMTFALARDGTMPAWFGKIHPRYHTPYTSVWFYGTLSLALALTGSFIWLAVISTLVRLLTYMVCIAALPRLKKSAEGQENCLQLPGGLTIPAIALILCCWLISHASLDSWLMTGAFILAGTILYYATGRRA